jgi:hypothetical protein
MAGAGARGVVYAARGRQRDGLISPAPGAARAAALLRLRTTRPAGAPEEASLPLTDGRARSSTL